MSFCCSGVSCPNCSLVNVLIHDPDFKSTRACSLDEIENFPEFFVLSGSFSTLRILLYDGGFLDYKSKERLSFREACSQLCDPTIAPGFAACVWQLPGSMALRRAWYFFWS